MRAFCYRGKKLYCEGLALEDIAQKVGTPFYCYSYGALTERFAQLKNAYKAVKPLICFSVKSNSNSAVLRSLVKKGAGLDIVSGGELYRSIKAGCDPKKIVYAGVGKTEREIADALGVGILLFNVESEQELALISRVATRLKKKAHVSIRINPDIDAGTHAYITTAKAENKFGINLVQAEALLSQRERFKNVDISGIHIHIGSQITKVDPFVKAIKKTVRFMDAMQKKGACFRYLNLGGGLGIVYENEKVQTPVQLAKKILPLLKDTKYKIIFEPGRFIAGNSGVFVTRITYTKDALAKRFFIVDGAMNDLLRPSLYNAYHRVLPVVKSARRKQTTVDIVGPICESGDFLAKGRQLQECLPGETLAFLGAGAYGFTMSSNYNSRPRVAEILVKGTKYFVVKKRETLSDLVRGETIPQFLK
jgi:diaminopimelate decarboxylase